MPKLKIVQTKFNNSIAVLRCTSGAIDQTRPLVIVNPAQCPFNNQVDYMFTAELLPRDIVLSDDNDLSFTSFFDKDGIFDENGASEEFDVSTFDDLIACIDKYVHNAKFWNTRHYKNFATKYATYIKKYLLSEVPVAQDPTYTTLYAKMGLNCYGGVGELNSKTDQ